MRGQVPADLDSPYCRRLSVRTAAEAAKVVEQFASELCDAGFTRKEAFGIHLAFEEALVNGVRHGNRGDANKQVYVRYSIRPDQVLLMIEDEGPGFNPDQVPDPLAEANRERPGGRGIFLMRHYMTWVQFNERGNRVTMCKRR
jgi:serine/threonine-protein kinase RsbW